MISKTDVVWAYRELLGRDPESDSVVEQQCELDNLGALVRQIVRSQEYLLRERSTLSDADITWAYRALLCRDPESQQAITDTLTAGSLGNVVLRLFGSDEFRIRNSELFQLPDQWVIFESRRGFRLWVNTADVAVSWQIMRDTYEQDEVSFIAKQVKPGDRVLDVGANIGYLTHLMALAVGDSGHVISFEPHPVLFKHLAKSVSENGLSQCKVLNLALGDAEGTGELVFGLDRANFGTSRILSKAAADTNTATCSVPVRRLDDVLDPTEKINFIKIDVEGNEPLVIKGATELLRTQRPTIMSEILGGSLKEMHGMTAMDYVNQVCSLGYQCRRLGAGGAIGDQFVEHDTVEFANVVFLPQN